MISAAFAIPGDLSTPTGGYRYDREVLARAEAHGVALDHLALPASFPNPTDDDLLRTAGALVSLPADGVLLADGLAYGALPESICASIRCPIVALVHHPLALESGIGPMAAGHFRHSEAAALSRAAAVIATSRVTARTLADEYEVPSGRITVAEPGTEPASRATGSGSTEMLILAVGAVSQRKGYDVLMDALGELADLPWKLVVVGATDRDPHAYDAARRAVVRNRIEGRVAFHGSLSDEALARLYGLADLFVMPSRYEGYGMVLAEAMARGLPIVATTGGAAAETVPDAAALKVPPGNAAELRAAIARALSDAPLRAELGAASWAAGQTLPRWDDTTRIIASVLTRVGAGVDGRGPHRGQVA
jgi:glycosyltransferase involved in cell wall biosynthesis